MTIETWPRPRFAPGGGFVRFDLFCFSSGKLADLPLSAATYGLPGQAAMGGLEVREIPRDQEPAWFDGFRAGALRTVAQEQLGPALKELDAATTVHAVFVRKDDPKDLSHLQAMWAVAKWLVARGATVVLDAQSNRFWKGADVTALPAERPFALSAEVSVLVESDPLPDGTFLVHTRGMLKFGRPDLVAVGVPKAQWDQAGALLRTLAMAMAGGAVFKAAQTSGEDKAKVRFVAYEPPKNAPQLNLNNDGLVVQDVDGPGLEKALAAV
ncbi:MAG: hypothetical protein IT380_28890 [Myxococcales bacterium]|nr:hypothetical protein [Myxococcales bacterium]